MADQDHLTKGTDPASIDVMFSIRGIRLITPVRPDTVSEKPISGYIKVIADGEKGP